jgi:hypothetical protein
MDTVSDPWGARTRTNHVPVQRHSRAHGRALHMDDAAFGQSPASKRPGMSAGGWAAVMGVAAVLAAPAYVAAQALGLL